MRLGVIGAGRIIPFHLDAALEVGFDLEAIVARDNSANAEHIARKFNINKFHSTISDFINSADSLDAILIASEVSSLFSILKNLSSFNIPILIEKPIFVDKLQLNDLESILNQDKILVGYNRRYYKTIQRVKEYIQQNPDARVNFRIPELSESNNLNNEMIRKIVVGNTVHMIDLIQFCLGPNALDIRNLQSLVKTSGAAKFNVSTNGSKTCELMFGYADNYSIELLFDGRRHVVKPLETITTYAGMEILPPDESVPYRRYNPKISTRISDSFQEDFSQKPGFLGQYAQLLDMTHGRRDHIGASFKDAVNVSRFVFELLDRYLKGT